MKKSKNLVTSSQLLTWWFPLLVVVVVIGGLFLVLIPQVKQIQENRNTFKTVEGQLNKAQAKVSQVSKIDVSQLDELVSLVGKALPEHKPYFEVLVTLQQLAAETGVFLQDFKLDPGSLGTESAKKAPVKSGDLVKLSTKLSISGTTESVSQFVERLQQALPLITTMAINISQNKSGVETDQRQAQLDLNLYYAEPLKSEAKVSLEPLPQFTETQKAVFVSLATYSSAIDATSSGSSLSDFNRTDIFSY